MTKQDLNAGSLSDVPNEHYKKFFEKFKEIDALPIKEWKPTHVLAHFCKKYKEEYNTDYKFKYNSSSPSKCFEVFQIKRLAQFLSSDPVILKQYIDWVFEHKVKQAKRKLTSISFLNSEFSVNEFKLKYINNNVPENSKKIDRVTQLPDNIKDILNKYSFKPSTYGDLAFIQQAFQDTDPNFKLALKEIADIGFDINKLKEIV